MYVIPYEQWFLFCRAVTDPRDGRRVALKKLPNVFQSLVSSKRVFRELKMLCNFKHENVSIYLFVLLYLYIQYLYLLICILKKKKIMYLFYLFRSCPLLTFCNHLIWIFFKKCILFIVVLHVINRR